MKICRSRYADNFYCSGGCS